MKYFKKEVKNNLFALLNAGAHYMYSTRQNAEGFLSGDTLKIMQIAMLLHFAFRYDDSGEFRTTPEFDFEILNFENDFMTAWVEARDGYEAGWFDITGAPCEGAIKEAIEVVANLDHPKREWLSVWGVPQLLEIDPRKF